MPEVEHKFIDIAGNETRLEPDVIYVVQMTMVERSTLFEEVLSFTHMVKVA